MAPYHILNTKQLARMFASFNPDYIIGIPFLGMNLPCLGCNVLGLPSDLKPREVGHYTFFILKNLPKEAGSFIRHNTPTGAMG